MLPQRAVSELPVEWPDWTGERVAILACGPSLHRVDVWRLKGHCKVIAVNDAIKLAPWADVLYACDHLWWIANHEAAKLPITRICADVRTRRDYPDMLLAEIAKERGAYINKILTGETGLIGSGYNSGFQALNLAIQFGARDICLLGFDASLKHGAHWHGEHAAPLRNPSDALCRWWAGTMHANAERIERLGVTVHNASKQSAIACFPHVEVQEWLHGAQ